MAGKQKEGIETPTASWFQSMDRLHAQEYAAEVGEEIIGRPDLIKKLGAESIGSFCLWAGFSRLVYESNIEQEVEDFINKDFGKRQRLHDTNNRKWIEIRLSVFIRDLFTCQYCGEQGGLLECDHKIPFSKGGSEDADNLVTACRRCNRKKRNKTYEEFKRIIQ
jgi:5-methylcytosine-specific restriction endonuclease McrA